MENEMINLSIIPAEAGFKVVRLYSGMDTLRIEGVDFSPVIGWRIRTYAGRGRSANSEVWSDAEPIVPGGEVANEYLIVRPDGCVDRPGIGSFTGLAAAFADYLNQDDDQ